MLTLKLPDGGGCGSHRDLQRGQPRCPLEQRLSASNMALSSMGSDFALLPLIQHQPRLLFREEVSYTLSRGPSTLTTSASISQCTPLFHSSERWIMEAEGDQQGAVMNGETGNILSSQSKTLTTTSNLEGLPCAT